MPWGGEEFWLGRKQELSNCRASVLRRGRIPPISYMRTWWSSWEIWKLGVRALQENGGERMPKLIETTSKFCLQPNNSKKNKTKMGTFFFLYIFLYKSECNSDSEPEFKVILWISTWLRCITGEIYLITDSGNLTNV